MYQQFPTCQRRLCESAISFYNQKLKKSLLLRPSFVFHYETRQKQNRHCASQRKKTFIILLVCIFNLQYLNRAQATLLFSSLKKPQKNCCRAKSLKKMSTALILRPSVSVSNCRPAKNAIFVSAVKLAKIPCVVPL